MYKLALTFALSVISIDSYGNNLNNEENNLFKDYIYQSSAGIAYTKRKIDASDVGLGTVQMKLLNLENELYQYDYSQQTEDVKAYNNFMCEKFNALPPSKDRVIIIGKETIPYICEPRKKITNRIRPKMAYECMADVMIEFPTSAHVRESFPFTMEYFVQFPGFGEYTASGGVGGTGCLFSAGSSGGEGFEDWGVMYGLCMASFPGLLQAGGDAWVNTNSGSCFDFDNGLISVTP